MKIHIEDGLFLPAHVGQPGALDRAMLEELGLDDADCPLLASLPPGGDGAALDAAAAQALLLADPQAEEEGQPALIIANLRPTTGWSPASSYAGLAKVDRVLSHVLGLKDAMLWYSSADFGYGGMDAVDRLCAAHGLAWPGHLSALRPGVNFVGEAELFPGFNEPPLAELRDRLGFGGKSLRVAGSVGHGIGGGYALEVSVPVEATWPLLGDKLVTTLTLFRFGSTNLPLNGGGKVEGLVFAVYGTVALGQASPGAAATSVAVTLMMAQADRSVSVFIRETETALPSREWIEGLFPGFADLLKPLGETFARLIPSLKRLDARLVPDGAEGHVELELGYAEPFRLFDDAVSFLPALELRVDFGARSRKRATLRGLWILPAEGNEPGAAFDTMLSLPGGKVSLSLAEGSSLSLPAAWRKPMEAALAGQKSLTLLDLELEGSYTAKSFSLEITTDGFIALTLGRTVLQIGDVTFHLAYEAGEWEAGLEATLRLGDHEVMLTAEIVDKTVSLRARVPRLQLAVLARDLFEITTPPELAALSIEDFVLFLGYGGQTTLSLSARARAPFAVAGLAITLTAFEAKYAGTLTLTGAAAITVDRTSLAVDLRYADGVWSFSAAVATAYDLARLLGDMAAAIGFARPFPDETMTVTHTDLALRFGPAGPRLALQVAVRLGARDLRIMLIAAKLAPGDPPPAAGSGGQVLTPGKEGWHYFLEVGPMAIDFASLPLVGPPIAAVAAAVGKAKGIQAAAVRVDQLTVRVASTPDAAVVTALLDGLPAAFPRPPAMPGKLLLTADLLVLDYKQAISYPTPAAKTVVPPAGGDAEDKGGQADVTKGTPKDDEEKSAPAPAADTRPLADRASWVQVDKSLGPVKLDRIGFAMEDAKLALLLDAGARIGPVEARVIGLTVRTPVSGGFKPEFSLQGLELTCKTSSFSLSGALVRGVSSAGTEEYSGKILISFGKTTIVAMGSYTEVENRPSLFIFATLNTPLGGPPFFFVNGLAAGIGFNRDLAPVTIGQVATHPFIRAALEPDKLKIDDVKTVSVVRLDQKWAAFGVRFTSFQFLEGVALLIVSFGVETRIQVLARLDFAFPPRPAPEQMLYAELAILAEYLPDKGELRIEGMLSPNSFLLHRDARLSGGFALYAWMAPSRHAGDFVLTIGGYHPAFKRPAHYPDVPRLALNWPVSRELSISGQQYFALTPSIMMVGGTLAVNWRSGADRAWFDAEAHFFIRFKPFSYGATVNVSVGLEITIAFAFVRETFSVRLGVALELWGPPFGGTARISFKVFSLSVGFGEPRRSVEAPLAWPAFREAFLPPRRSLAAPMPGKATCDTGKSCAPGAICADCPDRTDSLITISASGLRRQYRRDGKGPEIWVIDPSIVEVELRCVVPVATAVYHGAAAAGVKRFATRTPFGVTAMGLAAGGLATELEVRCEEVTAAGRIAAGRLFAAREAEGNLPAGIWSGNPNPVQPLVTDVLTGLKLTGQASVGEAVVPDGPVTGNVDEVGAARWSSAPLPRRQRLDTPASVDQHRVGAARTAVLTALRARSIDPAGGLPLSAVSETALDRTRGGCRYRMQ